MSGEAYMLAGLVVVVFVSYIAHRSAKRSTDSQLRQIHTLVNSDMTAARQSELNQTQITLQMMKKVLAMNDAEGRSPDAHDLEAITTTEARILELRAILADRLEQQRSVERQQAEAT